jgi:hypothetical protein
MRLIGVLGIALLLFGCNTDRRQEEAQQPRQKPVVSEQAEAPPAPVPPPQEEQPKRAAVKKEPAPPVTHRSAETERRAAADNVNPDALILVDFKHRIDQYMALHKKAVKDAPPLKETHDPANIKLGQEGLAVHIRDLRTDAKPGDIFTPEIRDKFRRLMYPEIVGTAGREIRQELKEDVKERDEPAPKKVPLVVNALYPEGNPLPTVPVNLLLNLPTLPEELEYRIIDKNLILRDVQANLIVDFIPNAIH